jgi:hypothetical protein
LGIKYFCRFFGCVPSQLPTKSIVHDNCCSESGFQTDITPRGFFSPGFWEKQIFWDFRNFFRFSRFFCDCCDLLWFSFFCDFCDFFEIFLIFSQRNVRADAPRPTEIFLDFPNFFEIFWDFPDCLWFSWFLEIFEIFWDFRDFLWFLLSEMSSPKLLLFCGWFSKEKKRFQRHHIYICFSGLVHN